MLANKSTVPKSVWLIESPSLPLGHDLKRENGNEVVCFKKTADIRRYTADGRAQTAEGRQAEDSRQHTADSR
jgi:hypothetical protein